MAMHGYIVPVSAITAAMYQQIAGRSTTVKRLTVYRPIMRGTSARGAMSNSSSAWVASRQDK
jgi:hypothetical protein